MPLPALVSQLPAFRHRHGPARCPPHLHFGQTNFRGRNLRSLTFPVFPVGLTFERISHGGALIICSPLQCDVYSLFDPRHETCFAFAELCAGKNLREEICSIFCSCDFNHVHDFLTPESLYLCVPEVDVHHFATPQRSLDLPDGSCRVALLHAGLLNW